jgi:flagellar biosynthesis anti-sigma factor FlgM
MKVESHTDFLTPTQTGLGRVDADRPSAPSSQPTQPGQIADQVSLSGAVQLVQTATQAAGSASPIRPDRVAEAKQLLADGKVGTDLQSLASSILDSLTQS